MVKLLLLIVLCLNNEHIFYAHPIISLHLFALFNAVLKHSNVPSQFGTGITISSLKDTSLDPSDVNNYRAITISPVVSKII